MLECFMMYIAGTLQDVVGELDSLIDALESLAARGELTFKNIRNAVLEVRRGGTGFWYRPPVPLNCRLGDVGYIEDGNFVVLENCVQEAFAEPASMYRSENKRDIDWVDEHGVRYVFSPKPPQNVCRLIRVVVTTQPFRLLPQSDETAPLLYTKTWTTLSHSQEQRRTNFHLTLLELGTIA